MFLRVHWLVLILSLTLSLVLNASFVIAGSEAVKKLAYWETQANAIDQRPFKKVSVENYEVPLELVESDLADHLSHDIKDSLIFEKDGKKYVRWIISPEDNKWHKEFEKYLLSKGVSIERHQYFQAYYTASRSLLVEDPKTGAEFSAKVSTDKTGGVYQDKKLPYGEAMESGKFTEYVRGISNRIGGFQNFEIMDEPAVFGIKDVDQGMVVRSLNDLPIEGHYYLPGFSALHDKVGKELALLSGSTDPAAFWNEHYNKPLARAMAEFSAFTGMNYSSPHSQNFLIELDKDFKPTGKIVFRDFTDSNINRKFFKQIGRQDLVDAYDTWLLKVNIHAKVGLLNGGLEPSWLPDDVYDKWSKDFYNAFEEEFSKITGAPIAELQKVAMQTSASYFNKIYKTSDLALKDTYFVLAKCLNPATKFTAKCAEILARFRKNVMPPARIPELNNRTAADVWTDMVRTT